MRSAASPPASCLNNGPKLRLEGMAMKWQATSRDEAWKIVAAGMRCRLIGEGLRISAVSECLRAVSYLCSAPVGERVAWEPAASVRLTGMVRRRLASLWPDLTGDEKDTSPGVMDVLDSMAELGDMVRLDGGKWLAAPAHAVRAGDGLAVLLGGGPMEVLSQAVAMSASVGGRVRLIELAACKGLVDIWEADDWIGAPAEGLETWSAMLLAETAARLTDAPNDMGDVCAYLPRQWVRLADLPTGVVGLLLCRARVGQAYSYFVGEFVKGRLQGVSTIDDPSDVRRLRFHLDAQANRPIRITATEFQGLVKLRLARRLPEREARVLLLGWQVPTPEGEHPGVTYHVFPSETFPIVRSAFDGLRIVLDEQIDAK